MKRKLSVLTTVVLMIDLLVKTIVKDFLLNDIVIIPGFFSLTFVKNQGAAFSILQGKIPMLIIISAFTIVYLLYITSTTKLNKFQTVGYSLFLGGILGNLFDRIVYGYVIDYIHFYLDGVSFPIFNIADICITVGALLLVLDIIRGDKNDIRSRQ